MTTIYTSYDQHDVMEKAALLNSAGIPFCIIENRTTGSEVTFTKLPTDSFELKVPFDQQESVIRLLNENYDLFPVKENILLHEFKHLLKYSNEDLKEVISKKDQWSDEAIESAILILESRGIHINQEDRFRLWMLRNELLSKAEKLPTRWLVIGFLLSLSGGIVGILFGLGLYKMKKRDLFGKDFYAYQPPSRKAGLLMIVAGLIVWILILIYQLL